MDKLKFEGYSEYGDTGVEEFSFIYDGDRFKILPKYGVPGSRDKLERFMKFVKFIAPKSGGNPWLYRVNPEQKFSRAFDIYKNGIKLEEDPGVPEAPKTPETPVTPVMPAPTKPEAEQMEMPLTASIDKISNQLEHLGCTKEAYLLDVISNTLDRWLGNKANLFADEIANQGIEPQVADKVLNIAQDSGLIK